MPNTWGFRQSGIQAILAFSSTSIASIQARGNISRLAVQYRGGKLFLKRFFFFGNERGGKLIQQLGKGGQIQSSKFLPARAAARPEGSGQWEKASGGQPPSG